MLAHLDPYDLQLLVGQILGVAAGGFLAYRFRLGQLRRDPNFGRRFAFAARSPRTYAALQGLAVLAGCTLVQDAISLDGEVPIALLGTKYVLAIAVASFQYAFAKKIEQSAVTA